MALVALSLLSQIQFCPRSGLIYLLAAIDTHLEDHDLTFFQPQPYLILLLRELYRRQIIWRYLVVSRQLIKSLIYKRDKNGPRFDPYETPQLICFASDSLPLIAQTCFLLIKI